MSSDPMLARVRTAADQLDDVLARPGPRLPRRFGRIVVLGTGGGSAPAGEALKRLSDRPGLASVEVCGEYRPPAWVGRGTLALAVSHSGSTKETLAAAAEAHRRGARVCAVTSGGELARLASFRRWPVWRLSEGTMPRALFYEIAGALMRLAESAGALPSTRPQLAEAAKELRRGSSRREKLGLAAARRLGGRTVWAVGAEPVGAFAAVRLKNQLAENAKQVAFAARVPAAHHDEIVGWSGPRARTRLFAAVLLRDRVEPAEARRRLAATRAVLEPRAGTLIELAAEGRGLFARLATLAQTADFLSVHAALLAGVPPTPVELIDELKRKLA